jgi:hypothetical protein
MEVCGFKQRVETLCLKNDILESNEFVVFEKALKK